jgi:hypothetical protein
MKEVLAHRENGAEKKCRALYHTQKISQSSLLYSWYERRVEVNQVALESARPLYEIFCA